VLASAALRAPPSTLRQPELRVLARPAASRLNPYAEILYGAVRAQGVRVVPYNPLRAWGGHYDIFHVHWPESVFNHGLLSARVTTTALLAAMVRLKRRGTRLLWTAHNLHAHGRKYPKQEGDFWARFIPLLDGYCVLTRSGQEAALRAFPGLEGAPAFVVPHPHYRGVYPDTVTREEATRKLGFGHEEEVVLFLGSVAGYKNVPALLTAFRALEGEHLRLVIAGRTGEASLRQELQTLAQSDSRIGLYLEHVPPDRLQDFLRAARLLVLPYREIQNSGSAVLGLSFDRPVLMPELGAAAELRSETDESLVMTYQGALTPAILADALAKAALLPDRLSGSHLRKLEPELVGQLTCEAYLQLMRS
jgi:beta-1,4-mannosyltransferase